MVKSFAEFYRLPDVSETFWSLMHLLMPRRATNSPPDMRECAQRGDTEHTVTDGVRRDEQGCEEPHIWTTPEGRTYTTLAEMIFAELRGDWSSESEISDHEQNSQDEPSQPLSSANISTNRKPHESFAYSPESVASYQTLSSTLVSFPDTEELALLQHREPSPGYGTASILGRHPATCTPVKKTVRFNLLPNAPMPVPTPPSDSLPSRDTAAPVNRLVPTMTVDELNAIWKRERSPPPDQVRNHFCEFWRPGDAKELIRPECNARKTYTKYDINPFTKEGRAHKARLDERDREYRESRRQQSRRQQRLNV